MRVVTADFANMGRLYVQEFLISENMVIFTRKKEEAWKFDNIMNASDVARMVKTGQGVKSVIVEPYSVGTLEPQ